MGSNTSKPHSTQRSLAALNTAQAPATILARPQASPDAIPLPHPDTIPLLLSGVAMHRQRALDFVARECRRRRIRVLPASLHPHVPRPFAGVQVYQSSLSLSHNARLQAMLGSRATASLAAAVLGADSGRGDDHHRMMCLIVRRVAAGRLVALRGVWFEEGQRLHAAGLLQPAAAYFECGIGLGHLESHAALAWMCVYGRFGVGMLFEGG